MSIGWTGAGALDSLWRYDWPPAGLLAVMNQVLDGAQTPSWRA